MIFTRHRDFYPQTTHNLRVQPTASCFYLIAFGNMDSTNGNNPPQGNPPHHDHDAPLLPNGNNQPLAVLAALPHTNKDLAGALQALQLQLQAFHLQQQEAFQQAFQEQQQAFQQQQQQINITSINGLGTQTAQGPSVPSAPGGPLQNEPTTVSPFSHPQEPNRLQFPREMERFKASLRLAKATTWILNHPTSLQPSWNHPTMFNHTRMPS